MGEYYENIEDAIGEIASALRAFQCSPPAGASGPLEAWVQIHFDAESKSAIEGIAEAINNLADAVRDSRE